MQENVLRSILLFFEFRSALSLKEIVISVSEVRSTYKEKNVRQIVQLLSDASCFQRVRGFHHRLLINLEQNFQNYESLRNAYDVQFIRSAIVFGFNTSPEVWSKLLYGTEENELSMELILNQLSTRYSFSKLIEQFESLVRCGDDSSKQLLKIKKKFKALCQLDFTNDNPKQISNNEVFYSTWIKITSSLNSIKHILELLINFNKQKINKTSHPPKLVLEGNKWIVEYYSGRSDLKITETNMIHTIYVYKCSNSTLIVHGKVNSITLDQCTNVGIQFTSVVSLVEFVNCCQIKAQVMENVPTIQIEKTDGCHIYLSNLSLNTIFITSKSSEMTINVPFGDGEYKEYPIPEQFKICLQDGNNSLLYQMNHLVFKNRGY
ncbi:unnamed protein product [Rotaria sp. Silwood2]|nr:unnamed protein product [Rotaria sp. Silwood2]CAF3108776.1 unnamed protein product [Rotaria sp. Silwood2]CAF3418185.1 unnamed protein product [Rotaria sp. Silwood2]CAF4414159.1 unnamed protein product [Rotaria sp. Silwood2]CAF4472809.1 unnamed protein product [Rotaria sp. Silwood2]